MNKLMRPVCVVLALALAAACAPSGGGGGTSGFESVGSDCTSPPNIFAGASLAGCNLGALDLSGQDLSGIDLHGANLAGANLQNTNFTGANLQSANLTNANFSGANLTNADLSGAVILGALFVGAWLISTIFGYAPALDFGSGPGNAAGGSGSNAYPNGYNQSLNDRGEPWCYENPWGRSLVSSATTSFAGATLKLGQLSGLDFRAGDFTGATLDFQDTGWVGCQSWAGGNFHNAMLIRPPWVHVDASGIDLSGATVVHNLGCDLDLSNANLTDARFIGAFSISSCPDYRADGWPFISRWGLSLNGANLTRTQFGGSQAEAALYGSNQVGFGPYFTNMSWSTTDSTFNPMISGTDFRNATLVDTQFLSAGLENSDFTGATKLRVTFGETWLDLSHLVFGSGWVDTTVTGNPPYDGSICPDGSIGDTMTNPCFV